MDATTKNRKARLAALIDGKPYNSNQAAFAKAAGLTKARITQLLAPDQSFGERAAQTLCNKLRLSDGYFENASGQEKESVTLEDGPDLRGYVPLISWVQAGYGVSAVDNLHPGEGEKIETTYKARRHTYALRVKGDSMEPKFPEECIIIVEPEEDPIHKKFVIIRRNGDEPTLKQYIEEGGSKFLKPLNPRYPIEVMKPDDVFCGVVKRIEMDV